MQKYSSSIRWGVVGCGQIAVDKSLPGVLAAKGARLVAVADALEPRRTLAFDLAKKAGLSDVRGYSDAADLFADPNVDAVYIALPTGQHAEAVIAAAAAKKAILCEKPLGRSAAEVGRMIQAARNAGVPLMTAYMSRFGDVFCEAKRLIAENRIGQVTFVSANFSYTCLVPYPPGAPGGWRWTDAEGGGPCLDIGVYLAFGIREMLDDRIARVGACQVDTIAPKGVPTHDTTMAWFQTDKGIPGTFVTTFSHNECNLTFYGTDGRLDIQGCFSQKPGGRLECHAGDFHRTLDTTSDAGLPHFDNYRREFEHYSQALLNGTSYRPAPEEALTDAILLDAVNPKVGTEAFTLLPTATQYLKATL